VRIVAATHRDLDALVREGRFREDLLYRLRVVPIAIPPLRERPEDIPVLAEHFVVRYAAELGTEARWISDSTLEHLAAYEWPGNVRELENAIKRALVLAAHEVLAPDDFAFLRGATAPEAAGDPLEERVRDAVRALLADDEDDLHRKLLERVERPLLEAVLAHTGGNQLRAAAVLGINRNTLRKKISELGIAMPIRP
jgi:two-component system nitrogen regulation response regulator GlnG